MGFAVVRILACTLFALIAPVSAQAQISDDVVKIGVLTDLSGPASTPTGPGSVLAAQMAVDDFGGRVAGKSSRTIRGTTMKRSPAFPGNRPSGRPIPLVR